jgi:hypothetical protein
MESKELIFATWVLVGFTGVLALSTIAYAITTWMLYRGSQRQIEALNELTKGILQLPSIAQSLERESKLTEELAELRMKQITINQQKALKSH